MSNQIAPEDVFGRDKLIKNIWKWLKKKSIIFTAERRIGKTTVMKVLQAKPQEGYVAIYIDVESVDSVSRFVETLLAHLKSHLNKKGKTLKLFDDLKNKFGGTEIAGIIKLPESEKKHWESTLENIFECVCKENKELKLLLMLDELPYMLQKIKENSANDSKQALTILDIFRQLREKYPDTLRMIFTGSVGLHHVLQELRSNKYASEPFNNMEKIEISPLESNDAIQLAQSLIEKEEVNIRKEELETTSELICKLTGNFPFYIEKVISRLATDYENVGCAQVEEIILNHLTDDQDHWELEHFRSRIDIYYPGTINNDENLIEQSRVARGILDILSLSNKPMSINEIWAEIKSALPIDDKNTIINLLSSLTKDNYLTSSTRKEYQFRFELIKKWWRIAQGLNHE